MDSNSIIKFLKGNYIALIAGLFFYLLYLQFTFAGNRICDCATTEKYNQQRTGGHRVINRFYHK